MKNVVAELEQSIERLTTENQSLVRVTQLFADANDVNSCADLAIIRLHVSKAIGRLQELKAEHEGFKNA